MGYMLLSCLTSSLFAQPLDELHIYKLSDIKGD